MNDIERARRVLRKIWPAVAANLGTRDARGEDLSTLAVVATLDGDGIDSMVISS
jgi:hypothetical protein